MEVGKTWLPGCRGPSPPRPILSRPSEPITAIIDGSNRFGAYPRSWPPTLWKGIVLTGADLTDGFTKLL